MRIAVIDLGTNTCNLLVAQLENGSYKILHQSKQLVKLGDNKIRENEISAEATRRTIDSFLAHGKIIQNLDVDYVKVIATSAVRTAENKIEYLEKLGESSGWLVKLITGEREAELIFKGVLLAFGNFFQPSVILDIGGGSNEIILAHEKSIVWKESRPTGMARIINTFKLSDPVRLDEIEKLKNYFAKEHQSAIQNCKQKQVEILAGCSGAFDTVADLIDEIEPGEKTRITQEVSLEDFYKVYETLLKSTREERLQMKGMDYVRVDLIVPAVIFIECLISEIGIKKIVQTDFALREGVLYERIQKLAKV
uniref:Ppx/GppA phosphatase family protein n=1 Tax=uncultured Draconibacterium sp. TaxID=1573823 RepID=UPI003216FDAA